MITPVTNLNAQNIWLAIMSPHDNKSEIEASISAVMTGADDEYRISTLHAFLGMGSTMFLQAWEASVRKGAFSWFGGFISMGATIAAGPRVPPRALQYARKMLAIHLGGPGFAEQLVRMYADGIHISSVVIDIVSKVWRGESKVSLVEALRKHAERVLQMCTKGGMDVMPIASTKLMIIMWIHGVAREKIVPMLEMQLATRDLPEMVVNLAAEIFIVHDIRMSMPGAQHALDSIPDAFREQLQRLKLVEGH